MEQENTTPEVQSTPDVTQATASKKRPISIPAAILTGAMIITLAIVFVFGPKTKVTNDTPQAAPKDVTEVSAAIATIRPNDRIRGDIATAQVAIIEYSDSDCPYCVRFHPTLEQIYSDYNGKVAWIYRYFPLSSLHPNAVTEAVALECVAELGGNKAFNSYLDTIINVTLNPDPKSNVALTTFATAQGIDSTLFKKCIAGTTASDRVAADTDEAQKMGAQGTPFSILVNLKTGKQIIVPGAYPIEDIKKDIDSLLK
jgi:protein-disulfide isomerase